MHVVPKLLNFSFNHFLKFFYPVIKGFFVIYLSGFNTFNLNITYLNADFKKYFDFLLVKVSWKTEIPNHICVDRRLVAHIHDHLCFITCRCENAAPSHQEFILVLFLNVHYPHMVCFVPLYSLQVAENKTFPECQARLLCCCHVCVRMCACHKLAKGVRDGKAPKRVAVVVLWDNERKMTKSEEKGQRRSGFWQPVENCESHTQMFTITPDD